MTVPGPITPVDINDVTTLNASGDTSACEFADWFVHTQVINGMYTRVFVYDNTPTMSNGVASGCPQVSYSYLDVNYTVQVAEEKERASYCSGLYSPQQIEYFSDSDVGGFGMSGAFTTSSTGYMRRKWVQSGVNADSESLCNITSNCTIGKLPGEYNSTYDTSATAGSHIAQLLMNCEQSCATFNQNLVEY